MSDEVLCLLGSLIEGRAAPMRMQRADVAAAIGMPLGALSAIMTGAASPSARTLLELEELLGVPAVELAALDAERRLADARAVRSAAR